MITSAHRAYRPAEQGSIFLLALITLVVLLALGASLIERSLSAVDRASVENRSAASFQLAEAGIHRALWALSQPDGWLTYAGESALPLPGGFVDVGVAPAPSERLLSTQRLAIIASGWLPGPNSTRRYPCTVRVLTHWEPNYFDFAIFGGEQVIVGNGRVQASAAGNPADVGTNARKPKSVQIAPGGVVEGNVAVGHDAAVPAACVDNKGVIGGVITNMPDLKYLYSVPGLPPEAVALGSISLSGDAELILDAGTYHITRLSVTGSAKVTCNGKVIIYLGSEGSTTLTNLTIGGNGIVNTSMVPANLILYCFDNVATIDICGNGTLYGGVYAPKSEVTLNSGDVYGSLVARSVVINGSDSTVYYDENLSDDSKPRAAMRSWEVL